jgi:hypothetical protein
MLRSDCKFHSAKSAARGKCKSSMRAARIMRVRLPQAGRCGMIAPKNCRRACGTE